jgi:hypothetical protein
MIKNIEGFDRRSGLFFTPHGSISPASIVGIEEACRP